MVRDATSPRAAYSGDGWEPWRQPLPAMLFMHHELLNASSPGRTWAALTDLAQAVEWMALPGMELRLYWSGTLPVFKEYVEAQCAGSPP